MSKVAREWVDHRYLGAIRFLHSVTQREIKQPLKIKADDLKLFRNLSQQWVIASAKGLEAHCDKFIAPPTDPEFLSQSYQMDIEDPVGEFLPRTATIHLPRRLHFHEDDNVFTPIDITLYPAPVINASPNWCVIRISVQDAKVLEEASSVEIIDGVQQPRRFAVRGTWLRVLPTGEAAPMQLAVSDERGEAIIMLPGLPITDFSSPEEEEEPPEDPEEHNEWLATGPVVQQTTSVNIQVIVNPDLPWPVDPTELEAHANDAQWQPEVKWRDGQTALLNPDTPPKTTPVELMLRPGEQQTLELFVTLPNPD